VTGSKKYIKSPKGNAMYTTPAILMAIFVNGFDLFRQSSKRNNIKMKGMITNNPSGAIRPIAFAVRIPYIEPPAISVGHKAGCTLSLVTMLTNSFKLRIVTINIRTENTFCPSKTEPTITMTKKTAVSDRVARLFTFKF
jgi:hypothetical protein